MLNFKISFLNLQKDGEKMDNNNLNENQVNNEAAVNAAPAEAAAPVNEAPVNAAPVNEAPVENNFANDYQTTNAQAAETTQNTYTYTASNTSAETTQSGGLNVFGLIGMILGIIGILSLLVCCCFTSGMSGFFTSAVGIPAVILGIIGVKKRPDAKGMAIAAIVTGAISIVAGIIVAVIGILSFVGFAGLDALSQYMNKIY